MSDHDCKEDGHEYESHTGACKHCGDECNHDYEGPHYMCTICGYDCSGLEEDLEYEEIQD